MANDHNQFSATSDTCETWRLRMPNVHDSLLHWATIVHWRNIIYDYMIQHFINLEEINPSLYSLGFKDKSRSVNSLARVARKHGLPALANHFINNMYRYPTMEVSEAFAKIQEQCKAYSEAKDQQVWCSLQQPLRMRRLCSAVQCSFRRECGCDVASCLSLIHI